MKVGQLRRWWARPVWKRRLSQGDDLNYEQNLVQNQLTSGISISPSYALSEARRHIEPQAFIQPLDSRLEVATPCSLFLTPLPTELTRHSLSDLSLLLSYGLGWCPLLWTAWLLANWPASSLCICVIFLQTRWRGFSLSPFRRGGLSF